MVLKLMIEDTGGEVQSPINLKIKNWKNKIEKLKIDPTLNWKKSEILGINDDGISFKTFDNIKGTIKSTKLNGLKKKICNRKI